MNDIVIKTENLSKHYGNLKALDDVSIKVKRGSVYGLIGRNGAGKTTLMRLLLGLAKPNCGNIELLGLSGKDINKARAQTGFIIENPCFYEKMTAFDNLMIRAKMIGLKDAKTKILTSLKKVNLEGKENLKVKSYSLGMRQNLGVASAILGNPKLLILDEPVNGLDPIAIVNIRNILLDMVKEGTSILISSHILGEIQKLCSCYGFILNGRLVKEVTEKELEEKDIDLEKLFIDIAKGEI